jgi:hypothetical protein
MHYLLKNRFFLPPLLAGVFVIFGFASAQAVTITGPNFVTASNTLVDIYPQDSPQPPGTFINVPFTDDTNCTSSTVDNYYVTIKARRPDGNEVMLVDFKKNDQVGSYVGARSGERLTVACNGVAYDATYLWSTNGSELAGLYDLYAYVFELDGAVTDSAESGFDSNLDEVELSSDGIPSFPTVAPSVGPGITISDFNLNMDTESANITVDFTDFDAAPVSAYTVTITIRAPDNKTETVIVSGPSGTTAQQPGDSGTLSVTLNPGPDTYRATFSAWDPVNTYDIGWYDIKAEVVDAENNSGSTSYTDNLNDFYLFTGGPAPPNDEPAISSVSVPPPIVIDAATGSTTLTAQFSDTGASGAPGSYTAAFKVRDDGGSVFGPYTAVLDACPSDTCTATYSLSALGLPNGWYDIYFEVLDGDGEGDVDDFDANKEEFLIESTIPTIQHPSPS